MFAYSFFRIFEVDFKQKNMLLGIILFVGLLVYVVQMILVILFPGNDKFDKWGCGGNSSKKKDAPLKQNITISINVKQKSDKDGKN